MSSEKQEELDPPKKRLCQRHTKTISKTSSENTPKEALASLGKIAEAVKARMQFIYVHSSSKLVTIHS